jgi:ketosteroid isomerase-like protein
MPTTASRIAQVATAAALIVPLSHAVFAHPPAIVSEAGRKVIAEEVAAFRKDVATAIKAKNAKRLERMYAPTYFHAQSSGKLSDKATRIATLLSGAAVIETAPVTDLDIRIPNDWVGIATGVSSLTSPEDGKTYAYRWTAVYVREGQSWHIASSQETQLHEIKP